MSYYVIDTYTGFDTFDTEQEAKDCAEGMMEDHSAGAVDGWPEGMANIEWGRLVPHARAVCIKEEPAPEGSEFDSIQEWKLVEQPVSEAAELAALREQVAKARLEGARAAWRIATSTNELWVYNGALLSRRTDTEERRAAYLAAFGEKAPL